MASISRPAMTARQRTALPGSPYDRLVALFKWLLPAGAALVVVAVLTWPLFRGGDLSFVLSKDEVAIARERLRVSEATYRGEDSKGQPFLIRAGSAVQKSSRDPVVEMQQLSAQLAMPQGISTVAAPEGRYDMKSETVAVNGPVLFRSADGYALDTGDVLIDLPSRTVRSDSPIAGKMPLGSFSSGNLAADLKERTVVLAGRARLRIVQRRGSGQ